MAYSFIASTVKGQAGNPNTTSPIDTTGADLIVIVAEEFGGPTTPTDSNSNTWSTAINDGSFGRNSTLFYCQAPTVGAGHTFTSNGTVVRLAVYAFSGSTTTPLDQTNHNSQVDVSSTTPGSVTPSENNELLVTGSYEESVTGTGATVGSSFTGLLEANDNTWGIVAAYKIQTTAGVENPTITFPTSNHVANSVIATFKAASTGGATSPARLSLLGVN